MSGLSRDLFVNYKSLSSAVSNPLTSTPPPDGGFGWVVALASFFLHLFVVGTSFSFGVFFPKYIEEFHESPGIVAWVGSIAAGLMTGMLRQHTV